MAMMGRFLHDQYIETPVTLKYVPFIEQNSGGRSVDESWDDGSSVRSSISRHQQSRLEQLCDQKTKQYGDLAYVPEIESSVGADSDFTWVTESQGCEYLNPQAGLAWEERQRQKEEKKKELEQEKLAPVDWDEKYETEVASEKPWVKHPFLVRSSRSYVVQPSSVLAKVTTMCVDKTLKIGRGRTSTEMQPQYYSDGTLRAIDRRTYCPRKGVYESEKKWNQELGQWEDIAFEIDGKSPKYGKKLMHSLYTSKRLAHHSVLPGTPPREDGEGGDPSADVKPRATMRSRLEEALRSQPDHTERSSTTMDSESDNYAGSIGKDPLDAMRSRLAHTVSNIGNNRVFESLQHNIEGTTSQFRERTRNAWGFWVDSEG